MESRQRKSKEKNKEKSSDVASLQFPFKLHLMLDNAPLDGYDSIVSWNGENGFKVLKKDAFIEEIAPRYFGFKKYRSFQRMLNMWGFERVRVGSRKGSYAHKNLWRGKPSLCNQMKCLKVKRDACKTNKKNDHKQQEIKTTKVFKITMLDCDMNDQNPSETIVLDKNKENSQNQHFGTFEGKHFHGVTQTIDEVFMAEAHLLQVDEPDEAGSDTSLTAEESVSSSDDDDVMEEKSQEVLDDPFPFSLAMYSSVHDFQLDESFPMLDDIHTQIS